LASAFSTNVSCGSSAAIEARPADNVDAEQLSAISRSFRCYSQDDSSPGERGARRSDLGDGALSIVHAQEIRSVA
jgi:hypothetical protein